MDITIEQYQDAITNVLSQRQIEILRLLYSFPDSTATAKELAAVLHPTNPEIIFANKEIGKIGKAIAEYFNVTSDLPLGKNKERPAFHIIIGPYYFYEGDDGERPGWEMNENLRSALEYLNLVSSNDKNDEVVDRLSTEIFQYDENELFIEGKAVKVLVNRYERNLKARTECIKHYGDKCYVCGFDFGEKYGELAKGFIHVHHLKPLSEINDEYNVNPITDLIPICANCHSVIHLTKPAMTIDELKKTIKNSSKN